MRAIYLITLTILLALLYSGCGNDPVTPADDGIKYYPAGSPGLDDLSSVTTDFPDYLKVEIIATGTPDIISISMGTSPAIWTVLTIVPITKPVTYTIAGMIGGTYPVSIVFDTTTGHSLGDYWIIH